LEYGAKAPVVERVRRERGLSKVTFSEWRRKLATAADRSESLARVRVAHIIQSRLLGRSGVSKRRTTGV